jgi:hypothetical protein
MNKRSQIPLTVYTFITLLLGWQLSINAQTISYAPTITNIDISQGTTGSILIKFDVDDPDGGLLEVKMLASKDNGQTYTVTPKSIMGDAFKYTIPGKGKSITWDVSKDLPGIDPNNIKIRLIADDGIKLLPDAGLSSSTEIQGKSTSTITEVSLGANEKMGNDGAVMVLIPAGDFEMGSSIGDAKDPFIR